MKHPIFRNKFFLSFLSLIFFAPIKAQNNAPSGENDLNGISVYDIVLITRHILGQTLLTPLIKSLLLTQIIAER